MMVQPKDLVEVPNLHPKLRLHPCGTARWSPALHTCALHCFQVEDEPDGLQVRSPSLQRRYTCPTGSWESHASGVVPQSDICCPSAALSSGDRTSSGCPCRTAQAPVGLPWEQRGSPAMPVGAQLARGKKRRHPGASRPLYGHEIQHPGPGDKQRNKYMYVYIYIYVYMYICIYVYMYI